MYTKQVIVVRRDLNMPPGKLAAMVAHAAMTFIVMRMKDTGVISDLSRHPDDNLYKRVRFEFEVPTGAAFWLCDVDKENSLEGYVQPSFGKVVLGCADEAELRAIETTAIAAGEIVERVVDSGHTVNEPGTLVGIAIGPGYSTEIDEITGELELY